MSDISEYILHVLNKISISKEEKNKRIMIFLAGKINDMELALLIDHMNDVYFDEDYLP